jgi:hypothetical protein
VRSRYLRTLLMQGARVILLRPANWAMHSFGPWLTAVANRLHHNVLATALANKLVGTDRLDRLDAGTQLRSTRQQDEKIPAEVCESD